MARSNVLLAFLSFLALSGCGVEDASRLFDGPTPLSRRQNDPELAVPRDRLFAAPERHGFAVVKGQVIQVTAREVDGLLIYQGDIVLDQLYPNRIALSGGIASSLWTDNIVPFTIGDSIANDQRVRDAIAHWESRSEFRFIPRTSESDYINFRDEGDGCWSSVGRRGGKQDIQLNTSCSFGSTVHEIGHALGLIHEQSRRDRDGFVEILWDNIEDGKAHNFEKEDSSRTLGRYDFGSIMHYGAFAFSKNDQPTIRALSGNPTMGQRTALSALDVGGIRDLYASAVANGVRVYTHANFRGTSQLFGSGIYSATLGTLGALANDNASSIKVPFGYEAKICSDDSYGFGFGLCREYSGGGVAAVGADLNDRLSYIRVLPVVTGFQHANFAGQDQAFSAGKSYRANEGALGGVNNDMLSSMRVPRGMRVRVCQHETGGTCATFTADTANVGAAINDKTSLVEVDPVIMAFEHGSMRGRSQVFAPGTYTASSGTFYNLPNDTLSSLSVPQGLKVKVCSESNGTGLCRDFGPGEHRAVSSDLNDRASYLLVQKQ